VIRSERSKGFESSLLIHQHNNMQLRSGTTIEVEIGTKGANQEDSSIQLEYDDFKLNPREDDGLKQSTASDDRRSKPFDEDGGDQLRSTHSNVDHILPDSVKSTNESLWDSLGPIQDWTSQEVLNRAARLVKLAGLDVPIKAEMDDSDYWEGQQAIVSDDSYNDSSDDEPNTSELLLQSDAWTSAADERNLEQRGLMDVPGTLEAEMDGNPAKRRKLLSASNTSPSLIN